MNQLNVKYLGIVPEKPVHSGKTLSELTLLKEDEKWEALETPAEAAEKAIEKIKSENRKEHVVSVKDLKFWDNGTFTSPFPPAQFTKNGFKKLVNILSCGGASYLLKADPDVRAYALNRELKKRKDLKIKVHTRKTTNNPNYVSREIFSVTGEKFPSEGTSVSLLEKLAETAPKYSKAIWYYDPNTATVSYEALIKMWDRKSYTMGDPHQGGVQWLLRDAGFGSVLPSFKVYRHACANMMMLTGNSFNLGRVVHRGSMDQILGSLNSTFNSCHTFMDDFYRMWGIALKPNARLGYLSADPKLINFPEPDYTVPKASYPTYMYDSLIRKYKGLAPSGIKDPIQLYTKAYLRDPQQNWQGVINGITHASKLVPAHMADDIQSIAGDILKSLSLHS